jgi:hypothetical protein
MAYHAVSTLKSAKDALRHCIALNVKEGRQTHFGENGVANLCNSTA